LTKTPGVRRRMFSSLRSSGSPIKLTLPDAIVKMVVLKRKRYVHDYR
jgi:hypothetical protein